MVIGSWGELIDSLDSRPGLWVGRVEYSRVRWFVEGFGCARGDGVLDGFRTWLSRQPQNAALSNMTWSALILHEVLPERDRVITPEWVHTDRSELAAAWPRPPAMPISEDDLDHPGEDEAAIRHLMARLREFLEV